MLPTQIKANRLNYFSNCAKKALDDMCSWLNNEGEVAVNIHSLVFIYPTRVFNLFLE